VVVAAATTTMVALAFLLPLALLVRQVARDRALSDAELDGRAFAAVLVATDDEATIASLLLATKAGAEARIQWLAPGGGGNLPVDEDVEAAKSRRFSTDAPGGEYVYLPVFSEDEEPGVVRVFVPDDLLERRVVRSWTILVVLATLLVGLAVLVADRLGRSVVRPVTELAEAARRMGAGDFGVSVTPGGPPEVEDVGLAFNRLADRVQRLLRAERELVADLSHRLRTPLTALRLDAEAHPDVELARRIGEDVAELERQVDRIIREARQGSREAPVESVDLATIVRDRVGFWSALAEDQGRSWSVDTADGRLPVRAHPDELVAAIDALIGNVFSHTDEAVGFWVWAGPLGDGLVGVRVEDAGPGFPGDEVVERGMSQGGSTGLGLDIARRTAVAAGGAMRLSGSGHGGALVELSFARADAAPAAEGS
jgi:signal transduction histidine kinase